MHTMRYFRICSCSLVLVLLAAGIARAAGDGHGNDWGNLAWRVANAAIVIALIWKLAGKTIASFFTGRGAGIARELDELEARKEKARRDLLDVEKRIANLESERKGILTDYETRGEALKAEILAKAEEAARHIVTQAERTARNEIDSALAALREELADKIIDAASESVSGSLSARDQEKLLNGFLSKVVLQ
jgi:F-type H+-transporting ATPase subunit b